MAFSSYAQQVDEKGFNFRKSNWGDSMEKIEALEGKSNQLEVEGAYAFETSIAGIPCYAVFQFVDNKLVSRSYHFLNIYVEKHKYIADYKKMVGLLTQAYGTPKEEVLNWKNKNDRMKKYPKKYGIAVSLKRLSYFTSWESEKTKVEICLKAGDNPSEMLHSIKYSSK
jgi:hypothetical protein